jgi:hypothetical protein
VPNSLLEIGGFARETYWDGHVCLDATHSSQASAEHLQQCAEFLPLRNRRFRPLAMTVLPIPLARRVAATPCAAGAIDSDPFLSLATGRASRSW